MGKQNKKKHTKRITNKWERQCERCGNEGYCRKPGFNCRNCGYLNGVDGIVEITRGGLER